MFRLCFCVFLAAGFLSFSCASPVSMEAAAGLTPPALSAAEAVPAYVPAEKAAVRAYYAGEVEESIRVFEMLADGGEARARKELAFAYAETGDGAAAASARERILNENPGSAEAKLEFFAALVLAGNFSRARELLPLEPVTSGSLFWEALLCRDSGETPRAAALLKKSLALRDWQPMGWFFLGELLAASSPKEAEDCFRKALRQDAGLVAALFPLAEVLFTQQRYEEAYGFFLRAQNSFPAQPEIAARIAEILVLMPGLADEKKAAAENRKRAAVPPQVKPLGEDAEGLANVRVGLAENLASLSVKTGGAYTLLSEGRELFAGAARDELFAYAEDGLITLRDANQTNIASSAGPLVLEYKDAADTTLVFDFVSEAGSFFAVTEDRAYRGSLEFRLTDGGITLVNTLNIEEYLYAVIPSEMPASWPAEALKAQAIAARSYTLAHLGQHAAKGFDLYGSVLSAAYRGVGGEHDRTTAAVDASRGVYLTAEGVPLKAYYSANHGGYSEDSSVMWGGEDAFMAAVPDKLLPPREEPLSLDALDSFIRGRPRAYSAAENLHAAVAYRWEKWVPAADIKNRNAAEADVGDILRIVSRGRGISGRAREVEIFGTSGSLRISGDKIRSRLGGLRSNLFSIRSKTGKDGLPEYFIFQGAGWGHGVGMDQSGAAGMAQAGFTAEEILAHYYPRARLSD